MALAYLFEVPDTTLDQYEEVMKLAHPNGRLAPGCLMHVAGPYDGGLRAIDVWESQEAFDAFLRERLQPALVKNGVAPPKVETWTVHNMLKA